MNLPPAIPNLDLRACMLSHAPGGITGAVNQTPICFHKQSYLIHPVTQNRENLENDDIKVNHGQDHCMEALPKDIAREN